MGARMSPVATGRDLEGKRAIITGSSRGLGAVIAEVMGHAAADLLLVARSQASLLELRNRLFASRTEKQCFHIFAADLREPTAPGAILAEARRIWPRLDILVNNAGIIGPMGMVADNDWSAWRESVQVNLLAPAELSKLAVEWMRETGGGGSIINLSGGGATAPRPRFSAYATAKCGLVRFTETIAAEVASMGIRVNCIAPGAMNTEMLHQTLKAGPDRVGRDEYERIAKIADGGAADPRLAADLAVYLASEQSVGVTGKLISAVWDPWRFLHEHVEELRTTDIYTLRRIVPKDRGKAWANA
jgi:NAD(P)-dependent dehydrogenase (short-subunit alcohol dehydrogenase family)